MRIEPCKRPKHHQFKFASDQPLSKRMMEIPMYNETINRFSTSVIIGRQGQGKTSLLMSMLKDRNGLKQVFDKVWVFLPNTSLSNISKSPFSLLPNEQILGELDYDNLKMVYDDVRERAEDNEDLSANERKRTLIVYDDVSTQFRDKSLRQMFKTMIKNQRHLHVSQVLIMQSWKDLEPPLRSLINNLFLFHVSKAQVQAIYSEILEIPKNKMDDLMRIVFQKPHDFMCINCNTKMVFRNFDRVHIDEDENPEMHAEK
ncbi:MAG: hypothetical protein EOP48_05735 [Sphingobacteriales bacterium]|nr:MAG: hypothetical protein EOP48_05735 [Sphingobacteriales bacterium]